MVDPFTQWCLKPLHTYLFSKLKKIPMDGTFHQLNPLMRVPWGKVPLYSLDLSSATDRLPIELQKWILSSIFGEEFAQNWENLLVSRKYKLPRVNQGVKYSVGQPMGALSSWAMLAVTHHFIVQSVAWLTKVTRPNEIFRDYAVLGDDIIIWNKRVARGYIKWMRVLGVELGLAKSVLSPKGTGLEFAKRTLFHGKDVSPVPFKEVIASYHSVAAILEFQRKYNLSDIRLLRFLGYGYKVTPNRKSVRIKILTLAQMIPENPHELYNLLVPVLGYYTYSKTIKFKSHLRYYNFLVGFIDDLLDKAKRLEEKLFNVRMSNSDLIFMLSPEERIDAIVNRTVSSTVADTAYKECRLIVQELKLLKRKFVLSVSIEPTFSPFFFVDIPIDELRPRYIFRVFALEAELSTISLDFAEGKLATSSGVSSEWLRGREKRSILLRWSKWIHLLKVNQIEPRKDLYPQYRNERTV